MGRTERVVPDVRAVARSPQLWRQPLQSVAHDPELVRPRPVPPAAGDGDDVGVPPETAADERAARSLRAEKEDGPLERDAVDPRAQPPRRDAPAVALVRPGELDRQGPLAEVGRVLLEQVVQERFHPESRTAGDEIRLRIRGRSD